MGKQPQWSGIFFEAESSRFQQLQSLYANNDSVVCVNCLVCLEGPNSLSNQLSMHRISKFPDLLSIDIDGCDYYLWKEVRLLFPLHRFSIDTIYFHQVTRGGFSPRVVVIEFNPTVPNHVYFIQEGNINIQQGSSLLALQALGKELGYTLLATTVFNGIFLRNDLMGFMPPSVNRDPDICDLHQPTMTTDIFQTYDGEIKVVGAKKLFWHKIAINPQKIQMLSKKDRRFPFSPSDGWTKQLDACRLAAHELIISLRKYKESLSADTRPFAATLQRFVDRCKALLCIACMEGLVVQLVVEVVSSFDAELLHCYQTRPAVHRDPLVECCGLGRLSLAAFFEARGDAVIASGDEDSVRWYRLAADLLDSPPLATGFSIIPALSDPSQPQPQLQHLKKLSDSQAFNAYRIGQYSMKMLRDISCRFACTTMKIARWERMKGGEHTLLARNLLCKAASCLAFVLELSSITYPEQSSMSLPLDQQDVAPLLEMYSKECDKQDPTRQRSAALGDLDLGPEIVVPTSQTSLLSNGVDELVDKDEKDSIVDMFRFHYAHYKTSKLEKEALRVKINHLYRQNKFFSWCLLGYTAIMGGLIVSYLHKARRR